MPRLKTTEAGETVRDYTHRRLAEGARINKIYLEILALRPGKRVDKSYVRRIEQDWHRAKDRL